ncbi:MAG: thymidylate synthase [Christensenellaceae bacterium]|jgi:thymidylate synthase|nr:thymidylate synthase [Christensenellaceae bacterium]
MSYADKIFINDIKRILDTGFSDEGFEVRPKWKDGTPAHTRKLFCIVNRYDLSKEFPIITVRKINFKKAVDEILWIWSLKSNKVSDLNSHIWDAWADENGTIGKAYGYQLGIKHKYKEGMFDQVDRVIYDLKNNPQSRRIMTNIYVHSDLCEMALYPCAYSVTFNVSGRVLNMILNQRSQDMILANNWNVTQYAVLQHMFAQVSGLEVGELVHVIADAHIYDRHLEVARQLINNPIYEPPIFKLNKSIKNFYDFKVSDFELDNYRASTLDQSLEVAE